MRQDDTKIKYFLYARKSSEGEDRQVQSNEDQIDRLKQLASDLKLDVVYTFEEARSAKKPDNRPLFDEMLQRIENSEANGILCWQINRLSRNPIDSGKLQWLLQMGVIKTIRTIDREYLPEDNVLIFNMESGVANQYILDLRKNVERGIQSKIKKGLYPGTAPLGYLNTITRPKGENYIIIDPERFPLLRKAWDLMLTGAYSSAQILDILNNDWGFRTRVWNKKGNKPISRSTLHKIFTNPFYTGSFEYRGEQYPGKHKLMVTLDEFDKVQIILGRKGKPRPQKHTFPFTGVIRCGECGCSITAESKKKLIKSTGEIKEFIYYHCTRRKKDIDCSQRSSIREHELEKQLDDEIKKFTILPEFRDWALEDLNKNNDIEIESRTKIYENQHKTLVATQKQLDNLTKMRYRDLIDDEEFINEKKDLQGQINRLKVNLKETEARSEQWLELTEQTFKFATYARSAFLKGDINTKKEILMAMGSNYILKDRKLAITLNDCLIPIQKSYPELEKEYLRLEPVTQLVNKAQNEAFDLVRTQWRSRPDSNRRSSA